MQNYEDCINLTEQIRTLTAGHGSVQIYDKVTGEIATLEMLTASRVKKLATMKESERLARFKIKWADCYEHFRDICLMFGFVLILVSKVLQAYIKQ